MHTCPRHPEIAFLITLTSIPPSRSRESFSFTLAVNFIAGSKHRNVFAIKVLYQRFSVLSVMTHDVILH